MALPSPITIDRTIEAALAAIGAVVAWQQRRIKRKADANNLILEQWRALSDEWRKEIADCHRERERLKIEVSSMRTLIIALRKIHEGEFPTLPEIEAELKANGLG